MSAGVGQSRRGIFESRKLGKIQGRFTATDDGLGDGGVASGGATVEGQISL